MTIPGECQANDYCETFQLQYMLNGLTRSIGIYHQRFNSATVVADFFLFRTHFSEKAFFAPFHSSTEQTARIDAEKVAKTRECYFLGSNS